MKGEALVVPALPERPHGDDPLMPRTQATGSGAELRLTGQKMFVCADGAEGFLVSASSDDGPVLCYVARDATGCTLSSTQTVDGRKLATLGLADTPADLIPAHPSSRNAVDALHNLALLALAAELLGVMEQAQEMTLDYLRIHFGARRPGAAAPGGNIYLRARRRVPCSIRSRPTTTPIHRRRDGDWW